MRIRREIRTAKLGEKHLLNTSLFSKGLMEEGGGYRKKKQKTSHWTEFSCEGGEELSIYHPARRERVTTKSVQVNTAGTNRERGIPPREKSRKRNLRMRKIHRLRDNRISAASEQAGKALFNRFN